MNHANLPAAFTLLACLAAYTFAHWLPAPARPWVQTAAMVGVVLAGVWLMPPRRKP